MESNPAARDFIIKPEGWTSEGWAAYMRTRARNCDDPGRARVFSNTASKYQKLADRFPPKIRPFCCPADAPCPHQNIHDEMKRRDVAARRARK